MLINSRNVQCSPEHVFSVFSIIAYGQYPVQTCAILLWLMPHTHRRRRRDAAVELSRVGVSGV